MWTLCELCMNASVITKSYLSFPIHRIFKKRVPWKAHENIALISFIESLSNIKLDLGFELSLLCIRLPVNQSLMLHACQKEMHLKDIVLLSPREYFPVWEYRRACEHVCDVQMKKMQLSFWNKAVTIGMQLTIIFIEIYQPIFSINCFVYKMSDNREISNF